MAERAGFEYYPLNGDPRALKIKRPLQGVFMAERAGFEPAFPFGKHALQACALNQTTRPLHGCLHPARVSERANYTRYFLAPFRYFQWDLAWFQHSPAAGTQIEDFQNQIVVSDVLRAGLQT